jgi:hypothetical protein
MCGHRLVLPTSLGGIGSVDRGQHHEADIVSLLSSRATCWRPR